MQSEGEFACALNSPHFPFYVTVRGMSTVLLNNVNFARRYRLCPMNNFCLSPHFRVAQGGGVTEPGWANYPTKGCVAIILLKKVYGLGWSSSGGEVAGWDCPAGTVFIASPSTDLFINWPEPVNILIVHLGERALDRPDVYNATLENSGASGELASFVSRQCLQLGQLIWEEIFESQIDDVYLATLYQALIGRINRGGDDLQTRAIVEEGLSGQASRQIEAYLKENFRREISVPDMAALLGMSSGYFATCFKTSFGLTPHQYVIKLRLDEAEHHLRHTETPIAEIAARLGFSSHSHLTTAFRKYRSVTPKEIRRR